RGTGSLPWVCSACVDGVPDVLFEQGARVAVRASDFLRDARAPLLAPYVEPRSRRVDAVLDRAGILPFFAAHVPRAGSIPAFGRPATASGADRPFPPADT